MLRRLLEIAGTVGACWLLASPGGYAAGQSQISSPAAAQATAPSGQAAREEQQRAAVRAIEAGHLDEAHRLLDQLQVQDGKGRGLWASYALLNLRENHRSAAILDFRKELANHPDNVGVYQPLAMILEQLHRSPEALEALRAWAAASPENPQPAGQLVGLLLESGQAKEAAESGKKALVHLPPETQGDAQLQYALGEAEIRTGDKVEGGKRLVEVLTTTDDLSLRNSVAYVLADAGLELPLAESTERQIVAHLELESEGWTLNSGAQPLQFGTPLLVAAWDTMGWILFREGKPAEAEPFVRASWRNELRGNVGRHLAEIDAALGRVDAAASSRRVAAAAAAAEAAAEVEPAEDQPATMNSAQPGSAQAKKGVQPETLRSVGTAGSAARHAGPGPSVVDPGGALQRLRTFPLGAAAGREETTELRVLLSRGKVVAASPVTSAAALSPGLSALLAHANVSVLFPVPGTYVQIEHLATLQCSPRGCDLVLQP